MSYCTDEDQILEDMVGRTFVSVSNNAGETLVFLDAEGNGVEFYHGQDCCESVGINDIVGELSDLLHTPILRAEVRSWSDEMPEGEGLTLPEYHDSYTWTFYEFAKPSKVV